MTVHLDSQNNSGQTGTAVLTDLGDGRVRVDLRVEGGPPDAAQPAHIHDGTCANLNPTPTFSLQPVVNGTSTTELAASLQQLESTAKALHVHKSAEELAVYVACADLPSASTLPRTGDAPTTGATGLGIVGLILVALGLVFRERHRFHPAGRK
ncbi:MAG: LPXTG cell wall anchor domain-containing protein [Chloroflexi bacterium]|nr:LPXTG cell wall anchor domain-containing protein [Chloroflexota bacterium]MBV9543105.1 LPXTG cell wall anchor domain-containing protein [Chloroflexota bacterium]